MKMHDVIQGSVEWGKLRAGIATASEFDSLVSPKGKVRDSKGVESYVARKLTEYWFDGPLLSAMTFDMDAGKILEEYARPWYSFTYDVEIKTVGFITTDDGHAGCSPDGLLPDGTGIEIKCPSPEKHVHYLLGGVLPDEYIAQVQGSLWVTGAKEWKFLSFRPRFPSLVLTVQPDPEYQQAITDALAVFLAKFEAGKKRLCELNGGPPKRYAPAHPAQTVFEPE